MQITYEVLRRIDKDADLKLYGKLREYTKSNDLNILCVMAVERNKFGFAWKLLNSYLSLYGAAQHKLFTAYTKQIALENYDPSVPLEDRCPSWVNIHRKGDQYLCVDYGLELVKALEA